MQDVAKVQVGCTDQHQVEADEDKADVGLTEQARQRDHVEVDGQARRGQQDDAVLDVSRFRVHTGRQAHSR